MQALHSADFKVPTPIDQNRHCVLMSIVPGYTLCSIREMVHPGQVAPHPEPPLSQQAEMSQAERETLPTTCWDALPPSTRTAKHGQSSGVDWHRMLMGMPMTSMKHN